MKKIFNITNGWKTIAGVALWAVGTALTQASPEIGGAVQQFGHDLFLVGITHKVIKANK